MDKTKSLKLKEKTVVYIDYANVYGWNSSLKNVPAQWRGAIKYLLHIKNILSNQT